LPHNPAEILCEPAAGLLICVNSAVFGIVGLRQVNCCGASGLRN
jgi:hypothetical protein